MLRLDRILANSGLGSRREVKQLIRERRVSLGGLVLDKPDLLISEEQLEGLKVDGRRIRAGLYLYYLLNKPAGYITSLEQTRQASIAELLPNFFKDKKITPAGRLDKDTTGLLILSNNGQLIHRLLSPRYEVPRIYYVEVEILERGFCEEDARLLAAGIALNDEEKARPAKLEILSETKARLELYEGKFHEVKRMMHAIGKEVTLLHRESYGPIRLTDEPIGTLRELSEEEAEALLKFVDLDNDLN